jgi:hypothetical protein
VRLDYGKDGLSARAQPIDVPPGAQPAEQQGLEALVFVPRNQPLGGTLIVSSWARQGRQYPRLPDWRPAASSFAVKRSADFDISDAALLPSGGLRCSNAVHWTSGLFVRIRG